MRRFHKFYRMADEDKNCVLLFKYFYLKKFQMLLESKINIRFQNVSILFAVKMMYCGFKR